MKLGNGWEIAADGTPWYCVPSNGRRRRGKFCVCQLCGETFPTQPGNPGYYCSRSCRGKVCGGSTRATRPDLFEQWTPEECWLAGLIWSDGYLGDDHGSNRRVVLGLTDEEPIAEAARIAGCAYRTVTKEEPRKTFFKFQFGERNAVNRIAAKGMAEPKLTTRPWPDLPYPASFLRGAFEGDGCACVYQQKLIRGWPLRMNSCLFGGPLMLEGAQRFLAQCDIKPKRVRLKAGSEVLYVVNWAHYDSLRLAAVLYSEPGPRMERKYEKFRTFGPIRGDGAKGA